MSRWHSCIVLDSKERQLWQFNASGNKVLRQETLSPADPLPEKLVVKDWPNLFQPKLNVAWLSPEDVFLRVIQLPKSDGQETQSMIDLQLEKLSPMPVAQIVWTFELLPHSAADMQTAIVIMVARQQVEAFLGRLEEQKYHPDRLELPIIDQLRATQVTGDGVWIFPGLGLERQTCLLAWWDCGTLAQLSLLSLPPEEDPARRLQEHLTQIAWAGEIEGWLTATPHYYMVATPEVAETWKALLPPGHPVDVVPPLPREQLAALTARRAVSDEVRLNLLPPEFAARYKQLLIDRLWIRALIAVGLIYIVGVAIYMGWAQLARWQHNRIAAQVASIGPDYTNTVQLKEEVRVLQDQLDLQFAALDAWKAVAEELPTGLQLDNLSFQRGRTLNLSGTASPGASEDIISFNENLQGKQLGVRPLFKTVEAPRTGERQGQIFWSFAAELARAESE